MLQGLAGSEGEGLPEALKVWAVSVEALAGTEADGKAPGGALGVADGVALGRQAALEAAPGAENEPCGQIVALMELKGQYEPAGQRTGAPEEQ